MILPTQIEEAQQVEEAQQEEEVSQVEEAQQVEEITQVEEAQQEEEVLHQEEAQAQTRDLGIKHLEIINNQDQRSNASHKVVPLRMMTHDFHTNFEIY